MASKLDLAVQGTGDSGLWFMVTGGGGLLQAVTQRAKGIPRAG